MLIVAGLVIGGGFLTQHIPHRAGFGIGDTQLGDFVVSGTGNKSQLAAVIPPLHIKEGTVKICHMVGGGGAVRVWGHVQSHQPRADVATRVRAVQMNHHSFNHKNMLIAGQGVFPCIQLRVAYSGVIKRHLPHLATIVTESGDTAAVWRPQQHRPGVSNPASVVGAIAVVRRAIGGELSEAAVSSVPQPEVVAVDEGGVAAIGREELIRVVGRQGFETVTY